ncbi:2OG-Fe(II) oxygenase family protein [Ceratobasidium sp. AG-Ba]|nr:2OG-Fe(II) oxygenase family protein [Ceratobasidium sp. AG-Ba]
MSDESYDSLFDEPYLSDDDAPSQPNAIRTASCGSTISPRGTTIAICHAPPIPGLYFHSQLLITEKMESYLLDSLEQHGYFARPDVNQIMLFGRPRVLHAEGCGSESKNGIAAGMSNHSSGLPLFLEELIANLEHTLASPLVPSTVYGKLFTLPANAGQARQAILNRYNPGEGIKSHIDLPNRFADGIIVISLGSGIAMDFAHEGRKERFTVWLPPRSIVVLEGEARWEWTHGIAARMSDLVDVSTRVEETKFGGASQSESVLHDKPNVVEIPRELRTSITLRWLLPSAHIVGA